MSRAASKYLELIGELRLARLEHELRDEPFTQSAEVEYISELDRWWREMTEEEQGEIELLLAQDTPDAPNELGAQDVDVEIGSASTPRQEAA
jgi:hypothetical protein